MIFTNWPAERNSAYRFSWILTSAKLNESPIIFHAVSLDLPFRLRVIRFLSSIKNINAPYLGNEKS